MSPHLFPRRYFFIALFVLWPLSLGGLELSLNGNPWKVYTGAALEALAAPLIPPGEREISLILPLEEIYPWLEELHSLAAQTGKNSVFWEESLDWDSSYLIKRDATWVLRHGQDSFSAPDKISLWGTLLEVESVVVWDTVGDRALEEELRDSLRLRGIELVWKRILQPVNSLRRAIPTEIPDLMVLDAPAILALQEDLRPLTPPAETLTASALRAFALENTGTSLLAAWPVSGSTWVFLYDSRVFSPATEASLEGPLIPGLAPSLEETDPRSPYTWDARRLEPLLTLLPEGKNTLPDKEELPLSPEATKLLSTWIQAEKSGSLLFSEEPQTLLAAGLAASGILPSPEAGLLMEENSWWKVHLLPSLPLSYRGLAVPNNAPRPAISQRLLKALTSASSQSRITPASGRFSVLMDSRKGYTKPWDEARNRGTPFPRSLQEEAFAQIYRRIGRLLLSEQLSFSAGQETLAQALAAVVE